MLLGCVGVWVVCGVFLKKLLKNKNKNRSKIDEAKAEREREFESNPWGAKVKVSSVQLPSIIIPLI